MSKRSLSWLLQLVFKLWSYWRPQEACLVGLRHRDTAWLGRWVLGLLLSRGRVPVYNLLPWGSHLLHTVVDVLTGKWWWTQHTGAAGALHQGFLSLCDITACCTLRKASLWAVVSTQCLSMGAVHVMLTNSCPSVVHVSQSLLGGLSFLWDGYGASVCCDAFFGQ